MEAELVAELPTGDWQYEPKWDGFRGVLENLGGGLRLWSRNGRPLLRYFPELEEVGKLLPPESALDGEIIIARNGRLEFDQLQMRLHPAESRIKRLSAEIPAEFVAFDILVWKGEPLHELPLAKRRRELERKAKRFRLSPAELDPKQAKRWLERLDQAGLDGVVAKRLEQPYLPGSREGVVKVKPYRTADCVIVGFRWSDKGKGRISTLLLGLYDDDGTLHHVGVCASFTAKFRGELAEELEPLRKNALESHPWQGWAEMSGEGRMPGAVSRWNAQKDLSWEPVRVERVIEVEFDQLQSQRFRRVARFQRWRPDKTPQQCTYAQLDVAIPLELREVFAPH